MTSSSTASTKRDAADFFSFGTEDVTRDPYPHIYSDSFLKPELFERLKAEFPDDKHFEGKPLGGRTGRDFYSPDEGFRQFLDNSPAWSEFYSFIHSPSFVDFVVRAFGPHMQDFGCATDPQQARFVDYEEGRDELTKKPVLGKILGSVRSALGKGDKLSPNDLYVRFDIEQGGIQYAKPVHCDLPNRLCSLVLYFCDGDEIGMQGGDLSIHEHLEKKPIQKYERYPDEAKTRVVKTVRPRENTGVLFMCSNNSYHSVSEITALNGYRKFIYLNVSSRTEKLW